MEKASGKAAPFLRFAALALGALALQGLPFLFTLLEGDAGAALYFIHLYAVIPLCALLLPFWAGLGGVHPLAAFFPVGGALLLLPVYHSPETGLVCLLISLVASVAAQEYIRRRDGAKGGHHGRSNRKKAKK